MQEVPFLSLPILFKVHNGYDATLSRIACLKLVCKNPDKKGDISQRKVFCSILMDQAHPIAPSGNCIDGITYKTPEDIAAAQIFSHGLVTSHTFEETEPKISDTPDDCFSAPVKPETLTIENQEDASVGPIELQREEKHPFPADQTEIKPYENGRRVRRKTLR